MPNPLLTTEQKEEVIKLASEGIRHKATALKFGVRKRYIDHVCIVAKAEEDRKPKVVRNPELENDNVIFEHDRYYCF
jgi:hypothetical protein